MEITQSLSNIIIIITLLAFASYMMEKAGIISYAIEAFFTIGALFYVLITSTDGIVGNNANQWWTFFIAGILTSLFSLFYIVTILVFKADQTVVSVALNFIVITFSLLAIENATFVELDTDTPVLLINDTYWTVESSTTSIFNILNIVWIIGIPLIIFIAIIFKYTKFGKIIKAVGENPKTSHRLGINVIVLQTIVILLAGFISGVVGGMFAQRTNVYNGSSTGIGMIVVAIVVISLRKPKLIALWSVVFGLIIGLFMSGSVINVVVDNVSPDIIQLIPYFSTLFMLILTSRFSKKPKNLGVPFKH